MKTYMYVGNNQEHDTPVNVIKDLDLLFDGHNGNDFLSLDVAS